MTEIFAKAGERVLDEAGNVVAVVKNDLKRFGRLDPDDFEWTGDKPNKGDPVGPGFRGTGTAAQVNIEGEWRP